MKQMQPVHRDNVTKLETEFPIVSYEWVRILNIILIICVAIALYDAIVMKRVSTNFNRIFLPFFMSRAVARGGTMSWE